MPEFEFRSGSVSYTDQGRGRAVVFLHGFLETTEIWNDFAKELSRKYRVICVDLPGHGKTSVFGYCHKMEFAAEAVFHVISKLRIRRFHLIGHSMGGYVAMAMAELFPDSIRGLCLLHSTSRADSSQKKKEREQVIRTVQKDTRKYIPLAIPNLFNLNFKSYSKEIARLTKIAETVSVQGIVAALEGMKARPDRQMVLRFAPFHYLIIAGRYDKVLDVESLSEQVALSKLGKLVILENSAHMGMIEEKDACLKALLKFLRRRT